MRAVLIVILSCGVAASLFGCTSGSAKRADVATSNQAGAASSAGQSASAASAASVPKSVAVFDEAIEVLSTRALGAARVDWHAVRAARPSPSATASEVNAAIAAAVARLADPHASFIPAANTQPPAAATPPPASQVKPAADAANASPPAKLAEARRIPTITEGMMLPDGVAMVIVPRCITPDVSSLRHFAQTTADVIERLRAEKPRGWVIDLRFNGGGNMWPMLLGTHVLFNQQPLMTTLKDGKIISRYGVNSSNSWIDWGDGPQPQLSWDDAGTPRAGEPLAGRVAVLLGGWTMSSGEALAICLASRPNTRSFGEPTAGLTTVTFPFTLSDGSVLLLPIENFGTADGKVISGKLMPDEPVAFGDWPTSDDATTMAARAWVLADAAKPDTKQK